jgi:hypothetical protein
MILTSVLIDTPCIITAIRGDVEATFSIVLNIAKQGGVDRDTKCAKLIRKIILDGGLTLMDIICNNLSINVRYRI